MYHQSPFYSPHSNFTTFLPPALKSGCNRAILKEGLFGTKSIIGERVQVDCALQGEGLLVLGAELLDTPGQARLGTAEWLLVSAWGPARGAEAGRLSLCGPRLSAKIFLNNPF